MQGLQILLMNAGASYNLIFDAASVCPQSSKSFSHRSFTDACRSIRGFRGLLAVSDAVHSLFIYKIDRLSFSALTQIFKAEYSDTYIVLRLM